ncbi:MAG: chromosome segregation protein SMC [Kosmotogaceae bacterium]|nr:chromosome segregation protein SMC [Kosmotogaceae bacterium]
MNNVDELLERFFNALENDTSDLTDEDKISNILSSEFNGVERETLTGVLDSLFGEVTRMAENPKEYFFSNEQEKLDKYLEEKNKKVDNPD